MSPESRRAFEIEWAALAPRLRLLLARKRVPASLHEDLLQETALGLLSMWPSVDRTRSIWPLAVTIALNKLRDDSRSETRTALVGELPEIQSVSDVETAGIARVELAHVQRAMKVLSHAHRSVLMKELGELPGGLGREGAADKMLRMRARRKLRSALERVSGLAAIKWRRLQEGLEALFALRDTALSAITCVACMALGIASTAAAPPVIATGDRGAPTHTRAIPRSEMSIMDGIAPSRYDMHAKRRASLAGGADEKPRARSVRNRENRSTAAADPNTAGPEALSGGMGLPTSPPADAPLPSIVPESGDGHGGGDGDGLTELPPVPEPAAGSSLSEVQTPADLVGSATL